MTRGAAFSYRLHMHAPPEATPTIMDRLRTQTQPLHDRAEGHDFQRALIKGQLSREAYAAWLGQMLLVHAALERHLRGLRERSASVARVVRDEQFQEPYLLEDLRFFGVEHRMLRAETGAASLIAEIEDAAAREPMALLGMHYVLEGSNNGNRFIAMALRKAMGLTPGNGDRYLDPYGERQRALWQQFKDDMNACQFTSAEQEAMLRGAEAMFRGIARVSDDLAPHISR